MVSRWKSNSYDLILFKLCICEIPIGCLGLTKIRKPAFFRYSLRPELVFFPRRLW